MRLSNKLANWKVLSQFVKIESPWLTIFGENIKDESGKLLEYWRVEKPNGLIVIVVQNNKILLPRQSYRPGVGKNTIDFCGGRLSKNLNLEESTTEIVKRELRVSDNKPFKKIKLINRSGYLLDSSFSNVYIFGAIAELKPSITIKEQNIGASYNLTSEGMKQLLKDVLCLQCRAIFLEWRLQI
jgi:hypothetical protein